MNIFDKVSFLGRFRLLYDFNKNHKNFSKIHLSNGSTFTGRILGVDWLEGSVIVEDLEGNQERILVSSIQSYSFGSSTEELLKRDESESAFTIKENNLTLEIQKNGEANYIKEQTLTPNHSYVSRYEDFVIVTGSSEDVSARIYDKNGNKLESSIKRKEVEKGFKGDETYWHDFEVLEEGVEYFREFRCKFINTYLIDEKDCWTHWVTYDEEEFSMTLKFPGGAKPSSVNVSCEDPPNQNKVTNLGVVGNKTFYSHENPEKGKRYVFSWEYV